MKGQEASCSGVTFVNHRKVEANEFVGSLALLPILSMKPKSFFFAASFLAA
jgi:hypothetical protein